MTVKTMILDIVSAECEIFSAEVSFIAVTGGAGELGIYPGHTALLTSLCPGQLQATLSTGESKLFYLSGGMVEVQPTTVTVLADTAVRAEELDQVAAEQAKSHAKRKLAEQTVGLEYAKALTELAEATAQLRAIQALHQLR